MVTRIVQVLDESSGIPYFFRINQSEGERSSVKWVMTDGTITVMTGVRQWCILSPLLFALVIDWRLWSLDDEEVSNWLGRRLGLQGRILLVWPGANIEDGSFN